MDALNHENGHLFSLPVALIFQNESSMEEQNDLGYNTTTRISINMSQNSHNWKKEIVLNGLQRVEKLGDAIRKELKWSFILHAYGFGCLFFILAFYTLFSIINIRSFLTSRPFMSTINGFLCLLGTSRAASLLFDPYNLKENMPKLIGQILWDLGFPSIISSFCLVQLAFLQFTQLQVGPECLRRKSCLSLIVTAHFLLTIGVNIAVASHENLMVVKHVVQYIFLTWGVFLCSNFLYTGYKTMSIIRSIPGGLKYRELPDASYKGIMQLAILAPHNNLGSMTTAFLPTLSTSKIHQQDNISLSAVGFRSEGNSRILESESIPMLEEMNGSSGEETIAKPLARGSSFQNQTRNSQKFNLKPKLSLRSLSDDSNEKEMPQLKHVEPKSPKRITSKNQSPKSSMVEFDFNLKPNSGILKRKENFVPTQDLHEFKNKIQQKTCFENENFRFTKEKKADVENACVDNLIPEILVSTPSNSENTKDLKKKERTVIGSDKNKKNLTKLMNEISKDLNEMQILREEKIEVHESKKNKCGTETKNNVKCKGEFEYKRESILDSGESVNGKKENRKKTCRRECDLPMPEMTMVSKEPINLCPPSPKININSEETKITHQKVRGRRKGKSLSWKKTPEDDEEEKATQECPLLQENPTDITLRTVLNHIDYVNRGASSNNEDLEKVKKSKVEWVLNVTYITAMWGLMLCLSNAGKIYSPFGIPEPRREISPVNSTYLLDKAPNEMGEHGILFSSWPWLWFQTFCRALELAMGCAMANITRQPAANKRYSRTLSFRTRDTFYNI